MSSALAACLCLAALACVVPDVAARLRLPHVPLGSQPCAVMAGCLQCDTVPLRDTFYELDAFGDCQSGCRSDRWAEYGYGECVQVGWRWCGGFYRDLLCECNKTVETSSCVRCAAGYALTGTGWCVRHGRVELTASTPTLPVVGAGGGGCDAIPGCRECARKELGGTFWEREALGTCGVPCGAATWRARGYGRCEATTDWRWCAYHVSYACRCRRVVDVGVCRVCHAPYALQDGVCTYSADSRAMVQNGPARRCAAITHTSGLCNGFDRLCALPVTDIAWAGTHNAGAHHLGYSGGSGGYFSTMFGDPSQSLPMCRAMPALLTSLAGGYISARAENQALSVARQLQDGIRFVDLDVCGGGSGGNTLYTCHCLYGGRIGDILASVSAFLDENPREVVIVRFDDGVVGDDRQRRLADLIEHHLADHLATAARALVRPLANLIGCRQRALVLWSGDSELDRWWAIPMANATSGHFTNHDRMPEDQLAQLRARKPGKLHVTSWFRTADGVRTLTDVAERSDEQLLEAFHNSTLLRDRANVILVDHYENSPLLNITRAINERRNRQVTRDSARL